MAQEGRELGFDSLNQNELVAAKIFLMADTIKDLSGGAIDHTDLVALTELVNRFHSMSDYERHSAELMAWGEIHFITVGQLPDWAAIRAAAKQANCFPGGIPCLDNSFTFLLCTLFQLLTPP